MVTTSHAAGLEKTLLQPSIWIRRAIVAKTCFHSDSFYRFAVYLSRIQRVIYGQQFLSDQIVTACMYDHLKSGVAN